MISRPTVAETYRFRDSIDECVAQLIDEADEVELIDMSPHALRQRMRHGNIYPPERAERALDQFFREGNLIALREMALRKMAHVCEQDLERGIDRSCVPGRRIPASSNSAHHVSADSGRRMTCGN